MGDQDTPSFVGALEGGWFGAFDGVEVGRLDGTLDGGLDGAPDGGFVGDQVIPVTVGALVVGDFVGALL